MCPFVPALVKPSDPHAGLRGGGTRTQAQASRCPSRDKCYCTFHFINISGTFAQQKRALSSLGLRVVPSLGEAEPGLPTLCPCLFSRQWGGGGGDFCPVAPAQPAQGPALSQPGDDGATLGFQCCLVGPGQTPRDVSQLADAAGMTPPWQRHRQQKGKATRDEGLWGTLCWGRGSSAAGGDATARLAPQ